MKSILFSPKIAYFLLSLALVLWLYSFVQSLTKNQNIAELEEIWINRMEKNKAIFACMQEQKRASVFLAVTTRPDDKPILHQMDSIIVLKNQALHFLETSNLTNSQLYEIIKKFSAKLQDRLNKFSKKHPLVKPDEISMLITEFLINEMYFKSSTDNDYLQQLAQHHIYKTTQKTINYLASKIGRSFHSCYSIIRPSLRFNSTLRKGKTAQGQIFLNYNSCNQKQFYGLSSSPMKINDLPYDVNVHHITPTFSDTLPQYFKVEKEIYEYHLRANQLITDTFKVQDTFIVYPQKQ